jgi:multiple sugar transport system permease protein
MPVKKISAYRWQVRIAPVYFLAPAVLMFVVYVISPIVQTLILSFFQWNGISPREWVGFSNYITLFKDLRFWTSIKNNIYWLLIMLVSPVFGLMLSLILNQEIMGIRLAKSLYFFPFVINLVVVGLVYSWFYNPDFGLLAEVFQWFGWKPIPILASENLATFGIIGAALWPQIAYTMILYITGLSSVDIQIIEAGRIDGAKGWGMFWHVVLPQLRPATFIALVVTVIGALRSFDLIAIMTRGGPWGSSYVLAYHMYDESIFNYKLGYGASIATVLFLLMDIYIAWFLTRVIRKEQ